MNNVAAGQVILSAALASRADNNDTIDLAVLAGVKDKDALNGYQISVLCRLTLCINVPKLPSKLQMDKHSK